MDFVEVGIQQIAVLCIGALVFIIMPPVLAIWWKIGKRERFTTILTGAVAFFVFAVILEKPIQNLLIFPTQMGLPDHPVSSFINSKPVLLALIAGLFPGLFEETGRFIAFKSVLKKRKNRETSISYGIGHGGFEVMLIVGLTYITYIVYAFMINTGTFGIMADELARQAPDQVEALYTLADQIAAFSFEDLALAFVERIFAVLFHIGASILVFYACRDKKRFWLYPLAIILHTLMDFVAALYLFKVIEISQWALVTVVGLFAAATFFPAYLLLYKNESGDVSTDS